MKIIITLLLAFTVLAVNAQDKSPVPEKPKPVFQLDQQKDVFVDVKIHFKAYQLNDYLFVEQNGVEALSNSPKIPAGQVKLLLLNHQAVIDSLNLHVFRKWTSFYATEEKVFKDTVGKPRPPENVKKH